jgi:hypothetical protein
MLQHRLGEVGEHSAAPLPIKELNSKATLEVCKTLGQRGRRHPNRCSRSCPGCVVGNCDEVFELTKWNIERVSHLNTLLKQVLTKILLGVS